MDSSSKKFYIFGIGIFLLLSILFGIILTSAFTILKSKSESINNTQSNSEQNIQNQNLKTLVLSKCDVEIDYIYNPEINIVEEASTSVFKTYFETKQNIEYTVFCSQPNFSAPTKSNWDLFIGGSYDKITTSDLNFLNEEVLKNLNTNYIGKKSKSGEFYFYSKNKFYMVKFASNVDYNNNYKLKFLN